MLSARAACVGARRAKLFGVLSWLPCAFLFSGLARVLDTLVLKGAALQMYNLPSGSCGGRAPECMCRGGSGPCLKQGLKRTARQGPQAYSLAVLEAMVEGRGKQAAWRGFKVAAWRCLKGALQPGEALSSRPGGA